MGEVLDGDLLALGARLEGEWEAVHGHQVSRQGRLPRSTHSKTPNGQNISVVRPSAAGESKTMNL